METSVAPQGVCIVIMTVCILSPCISVSAPPTMSCPAVQVGQEGSNITCVADIDTSSINISRNGTRLVECNTTMCTGDQGYKGTVTTNGTHLTLSMTIESVQRRDESMLTCDVNLGNESTQINSSFCKLFIFVSPEKPVCNYTFNESHALITCSTARIYPTAKCLWNAASELKVKFGSSDVQASNSSFFSYNTTCTATFPVTNQTEYILNVTIFPNDLTGQDISRGAAVKTKKIVITVVSPKGLPSLTITPKQNEYTEFDNVTIWCTVHGGQPTVYKTSLDCDRELTDTGSSSNNVTGQGQVQMNFQLKGSMHGKSCTCSGSHVSSNYHLKNHLTFVEIESDEEGTPGGFNETLRKYSLNITSALKDAPVCPNDLRAKYTARDWVTLTWKSGNHDGLQKIFTIIRHDERNGVSRDNRTQVVVEGHTSEDVSEFNITQLSQLTRYVISLNTGSQECPEVSVNVTTEGEEESTTSSPSAHEGSGPDAMVFIISIAFLMLPAIITTIIVSKMKRRRGDYQTNLHRKEETTEMICNKELNAVTNGDPDPSESGNNVIVIVGPKFNILDFEISKLRPHGNRKQLRQQSDYQNTPEKPAVERDTHHTGHKGSAEGSAYFNVEINPSSKNSIIKEMNQVVGGSERVEYLTMSKSNVSTCHDITDLACNDKSIPL